MNNSILDLLVYFFSRVVYEETPPKIVLTDVKQELVDAGFAKKDIKRAMTWLIDLMKLEKKKINIESSSARIYSKDEQNKINTESRGFLLEMEKLRVINSHLREVIVHQLMELDEDVIMLDDLKWVVLMLIFDQKDKQESFIWLQRSIINEDNYIQAH